MKEHVFHQIWVRFSPEFRYSRTTTNEQIEIIKTGSLNFGDGPDFHLASVSYQGIIHYGDIELHLKCTDWYSHKHHLDPAYNSVVLHVVLDEKEARPVLRQDGTRVPTLAIGNKIPLKLLSTIRESVDQYDLSCKQIIRTISSSVIEKQLEMASRLYLDQKIQQLLLDFDTRLPPSQAWLKMVFMAWARGLGIPSNSHQLVELALFMWEHKESSDSHLLRQKIASIPWDHSGSRPGNRPHIRYKQLQVLLQRLSNDTFRSFVTGSADSMISFFDTPSFGGKERRKLLLSIVIAPALCILADLVGKQEFKAAGIHHWSKIGFSAPYSIKQPFKKAGITHLKEYHSPGLVYQYKHFCKNKACDRCLIFKNVVGG